MDNKPVGKVENKRIICPSCGAKYKLPENRTLNYPVNIKCKKCSARFVVNDPGDSSTQNSSDEEKVRKQQKQPSTPNPPAAAQLPKTRECFKCDKKSEHADKFGEAYGYKFIKQNSKDTSKYEKNNKPRKPWIAGLLTFFSVGLGHVYTGEAKRGIILFLCQGLLLLFVPLIFIASPIYVIAAGLICALAYFIFCLLDSIKCARTQKSEYQLKKYNKWYLYVAYWVVVSILIQPIVEAGIKGYAVQAYKIPSGAMTPTLMPGDHILVNKYIFKTSAPQRGDVAVFEFPKDPTTDYIKRVVAIEGDTIEIKDKQLFINGVRQNETFVNYTDNNIFPSSTNYRDNLGPVTVPANAFFFMGDNRDNSYDSRFWGFVNKEKIKGKAICNYWSWDTDNSQIRWGRIGKAIK